MEIERPRRTGVYGAVAGAGAAVGAAGTPIRVLIVDDSSVMRRLLADLLASDPAVTVVGTAANGRIALGKIAETNPDLITLDVEMPELDGLATLSELRRTNARIRVIMLSTTTVRGAGITVEALTRGANDYVAKPTNMQSAGEALNKLRDELLVKIKALCPGARGPAVMTPSRAPAVVRTVTGMYGAAAPTPPPPADIIAVGVSTGGPNALAELIPALPARLPVPIVIVQHMPEMFTKLLAERLSSLSAIPVEEGIAGRPLQAGRAYLAPGNQHMLVQLGRAGVELQLNQGPPEHSCRPAVDVLFRSVAAVYKSRALAVILTGMGRDGLDGCQAIRAAGGQILIQNEASSVVWGMPGQVARAGLANGIHSLAELAAQLVRRTERGAAHRASVTVPPRP